jgi:hypothetical protein
MHQVAAAPWLSCHCPRSLRESAGGCWDRLTTERLTFDKEEHARATNTLADKTDEFGVTRFYFDELILVVPAEADRIRAVGRRGPDRHRGDTT